MELNTNKLPARAFTYMDTSLEDFVIAYKGLLQKRIDEGALSNTESDMLNSLATSIMIKCENTMQKVCENMSFPRDMESDELINTIWNLILCGRNNDFKAAKILKWERTELTFEAWLIPVAKTSSIDIVRVHPAVRRYKDEDGKEAWEFRGQITFDDSIHDGGNYEEEGIAKLLGKTDEGIETLIINYWPSVEFILSKLPKIYSDALLDRYIHVLSAREAAIKRGCKVEAMKKRRKRALEAARKIKYEHEGEN